MARPLSPGELQGPGRPAEGDLVRVAGRVIAINRGSLTLADALGRIEVEIATLDAARDATAAQSGEPAWQGLLGALMCVEGRFEAGQIATENVRFRRELPTPKGNGDVDRFLFSGVGARLAQRARGLQTIRRYFEEEGFLEVDTPCRIPSPAPEPQIRNLRAESGFLIASPELQMKRLLVGGLPRVYQVAHCSRGEEQGWIHQPEFTLVEWYRAFEGEEAVLRDTEALVERVVRVIHGSSRLPIGDGRSLEVTAPFERVTVAEAFHEYAAVEDATDLAATDEFHFYELLVTHVEPALAQLDRPVFLTEYPASQASLARRKPTNPSVAERFELYAAGVELCNGFGELVDPAEQRARFEHDHAAMVSRGLPVGPLDARFLQALEEGMPEAGGNALGFDRLVMLAVGARSIAEVMAFPTGTL